MIPALVVCAVVALVCTGAAVQIAHVNRARHCAAAGLTFSLFACTAFWAHAAATVLFIIQGAEGLR